MGRVTVRFLPHNDLGVLDHDVTLPSGTTANNPVRVLSHPNGAEILFTVRQIELGNEEFERDLGTVAEDCLAHCWILRFVVLRRMGTSLIGGRGAQWVRELNARHPWSHNDYFHSWVLANLPQRRERALDVGCGRGGLVRALAPHFGQVTGTDRDSDMRRLAQFGSGDLANVSITGRQFDSWADDSVDLITMVAVLHHLEIEDALLHVERILAPQGRLLVVGLAQPRSARDHLWDAASIVTNPLIGFLHHPWPSPTGSQPPPFPVKDPVLSYDELKKMVDNALPGAVMRHRIGFRHTIEWTKPRAQWCVEMPVPETNTETSASGGGLNDQ